MTAHNTFISWNCNGVSTHYQELQILIASYNPAVICLQETHLKPNHTFKLLSYNVISSSISSRERARGGVLLAIRSDLHFQQLSLNSDLQVLAATVYLGTPVTICTVYLPPHEDVSFGSLSQLLGSLPPSSMVVGDFNAHNPIWGSGTLNSRGRIIEEVVDSFHLAIMNTRVATHYSFAYRSWSNIDLILCFPRLSGDFLVHTHTDLAGSDHFPMVIRQLNHGIQHIYNVNVGKRYNYTKTDWSKYTQSLIHNHITIDTTKGPGHIVREFTDHLITCAQTHSPELKIHNTYHRRVPWWTNQCSISIRERRQALKNLKRDPSTEHHIHFKKLRAKARWTLKQARKNSWNTYVSTIRPSTPVKQIWHKVRAIEKASSYFIPTNISMNGTVVTGLREISELFADFFSQLSSPDNLPSHFFQTPHTSYNSIFDFNSENTEHYNQPITLHELKKSIKDTKPAAVGPDGFHIHMLQHAPPHILNTLLDIFNEIWFSGSFPATWRDATIIPILKMNKNPSLLDSYRPISLTSVLCKVLERIVKNRLQWELERRKLLSPVQSGFRCSRSTLDRIVLLQNSIIEAFTKKQHFLAIFFDFNKAFDSIWRHKIMDTLHKWNFRGRLVVFVLNFLTSRKFNVKLGPTLSTTRDFINGVPQGSVLSPILFNVAINDVVDNVSFPIKPALFADDLTISLPCSDIGLGEEVLQEAINKLYQWSLSNGLQFSTTKTAAVHFCRRNHCQHKINVHINGTPVPTFDKIRYLGVVFDDKLTWKPHIDSLKRSCTCRLNLLKKLAHTSYGADRSSLMTIYHSLIRSKIDYGVAAYGSASIRDLQKLNTVHHTAIRLATGAYRTSPIDSLLAESSEWPLDLRMWYLTVTSFLHEKSTADMCGYPNPDLHTGIPHANKLLSHRANSLFRTLDILCPPLVHRPLPAVAPWVSYTVHVDASITDLSKTAPSIALLSAYHEMVAKYTEFSIIFTDGSKSTSGVGCSVVFNDDIIRFSLPQFFSVLSAELYAIKLAAQCAVDGKLNNNNFLICSDSLSALHSLRGIHENRTHPFAKEIINLVANASVNIHFAWVPGHSGIPGNTEADQAAKEAALSLPAPNLPVPVTDLRTAVRSAFARQWRHSWETQPFTNKLRNIKPTTDFWTSSIRGNRREEVVLCRLRIGHTSLTHSHLFGNSQSIECPLCHTPVTTHHILLDCPLYSTQRDRYRISTNLQDSLSDNSESVDRLILFLKSIGVFHRI